MINPACVPVSTTAPPLRSRTVYDEEGYITKPVHRKYVFKPTLFTRIKNLFWRSRTRRSLYTTGGALPLRSRFSLFNKARLWRRSLTTTAPLSAPLVTPTATAPIKTGVPPLRSKVVYDEQGYIPTQVHRKYVFKPTLWTRLKDFALA
jgi:hypothetical protein